jgi:hypothetical protein
MGRSPAVMGQHGAGPLLSLAVRARERSGPRHGTDASRATRHATRHEARHAARQGCSSRQSRMPCLCRTARHSALWRTAFGFTAPGVKQDRMLARPLPLAKQGRTRRRDSDARVDT